ncbi:streptophobe family protein, partial [Streptomyces pseudovenezuelae]|uniref:streptophobe family protein n=1 Tax=Streptomyces pseudovenezuelae TaxID=67350 RepID=UPI0036EB45DC
MSASTDVETTKHAVRLPWGDILLSATAAVSWALIGMAGAAALGLHLLEADSAASLGPMTAAVVALAAGGSVTPSGDVSAFGLTGAQAATAIEITPLGVSLVGAVLLSWFFLRSLRGAGAVIAPSELLARAGSVVVLFTAMMGGLAWAGHDVITIDGGALGLDKLPGAGGGGGLDIPGLGDVGDIGGLLPDRIGDLVDAKAAVGFTVDTAPTLLGGLGWSVGILLVALLASRRTPLPRGWEAVHRVVRPAVSALVTVLLVAVAAGLSAAAYAAIGDDHPKRIAGAALLGAPNGVWLGIPVGLFVPFDGRATGVLTNFLPAPLDRLLDSDSDQSMTLGRLAELDGRVWLLGVGAALMMLLAGVLTAVRTPVGGRGDGTGAAGFAGRCAVRLGVATALALPLLAWLTEVSVDASLSVLGFDAFGAGVRIQGQLGMAVLLGALWGAGAGAAGALLARATGAAGSRASGLALGDSAGGPGAGSVVGSGSGSVGAWGAGAGAPYGGGAGAGWGGGGPRPGEAGGYEGGGGASGGMPRRYEGGAASGRYEGEAGAAGGAPGRYDGTGGSYDDVSRSYEGGARSFDEGAAGPYGGGEAGPYRGGGGAHPGGARSYGEGAAGTYSGGDVGPYREGEGAHPGGAPPYGEGAAGTYSGGD